MTPDPCIEFSSAGSRFPQRELSLFGSAVEETNHAATVDTRSVAGGQTHSYIRKAIRLGQ